MAVDTAPEPFKIIESLPGESGLRTRTDKQGQGGEGVAGGNGGDDQRKVQKKTTKPSGLNHHSRSAGIIRTLRLRLPRGLKSQRIYRRRCRSIIYLNSHIKSSFLLFSR